MAEALMKSANTLFDRYYESVDRNPDGRNPKAGMHDWEIMPVAYMLTGFALENIIKAIWFCKKPGDLREYRTLFTKRGHDLPWLAESAGISPLSEDETKMLTCLVEYTTWAGRYPAATNLRLLSIGFKPEVIAEFYTRCLKEYEAGYKQFGESLNGTDAEGFPLT
jgi:hypothetical protein